MEKSNRFLNSPFLKTLFLYPSFLKTSDVNSLLVQDALKAISKTLIHRILINRNRSIMAEASFPYPLPEKLLSPMIVPPIQLLGFYVHIVQTGISDELIRGCIADGKIVFSGIIKYFVFHRFFFLFR